MKKSCVNAIIFSDDRSKILITKRRDTPIWVLPGGGIDEGESPEKAVVREAFEETGCQVEIVRKTGLYHPVNRLTATSHLYECRVVGGKPQIGDETREIGFFSLHTLPKSFFHVHKGMVDDALLESKTVIERRLTQATYVKIFLYFMRHPIRTFRYLLSELGVPFNSKS